MIRKMLLMLVLALAAVPLSAQSGLPPAPYAYQQLSDPALEAQARTLMHTLRCLVCQGQSIADSDAPLAGDMRSQVRERLLAGEQPEAIRAWLVARYGSWVSYEPPLGADTLLLYLAPLIALIGGIWIAFGRMRWRRDEKASGDGAA